jgi:hypothetical protein
VPLLLVVLLVLVILCLLLLSVPFALFQRYRMGTARRPARGWVATINVFAFAISAALLLVGAAVTNLWVPHAVAFTLAGLVAGGLLGVAGLAMSRWEVTPLSLHYTPNRWLVLAIMLLVSARLIYGVWRGWNAWQTSPDHASWLAASGAAGSLGAGALVLGYYLLYWAGVRLRAERHRLMTSGARRQR